MVGEEIQASVRDTGIGIAEDSIPHIFEEFYRAENAREFLREGTGLGLPIVKEIVEAHGGRVEVDSTLGKGTEFRVCLPMDKG